MAETDRRTRAISRVLPRVPQRFISDERLVALLRRGDRGAFESLYDRHIAELLSFCFFMLGSREDAEDAVQSTFASAYRALLRDDREIDLRPWLFAIARNACIGILRKRRPPVFEWEARIAGEDVLAKVERRESLRQLLSGMLDLPERHRTALVLAELLGHSQSEIGRILGVPPATVKSYIFQARSTLASERVARETDCRQIREELLGARGAALLRGHLRRHLRACAGCREYAEHVSRRRRELGALLPFLPSLALKRRVLEATAGQAAGTGACVGGASVGVTFSGAIELGGATGAKTLLAKVLIAAAGIGAGAGAGTLVLGVASSQPIAPKLHLAAAGTSTAGRGGEPGAGSGSNSPGVGPGTPLAFVAPAAGVPSARSKSPGQPRAPEPGHEPVVTALSRPQHTSTSGNGGARAAKANGRSAERGKSAAAHAASKGQSAEHGRSSTAHGGSHAHGGFARGGSSAGHGSGNRRGFEAKLNAGANGASAANGNRRAVGRTNPPAGTGTGASGNSAGHAHGALPASGGGANAGNGQAGGAHQGADLAGDGGGNGASVPPVSGPASSGPALDARPTGSGQVNPSSAAAHEPGAGASEKPEHAASKP